ncbi:MAG TPA: TasA family protein [Candidatus Limnocylindrales bacterium]|nr:TasA family protein [Candidatus Limnocylindrales bacterium]
MERTRRERRRQGLVLLVVGTLAIGGLAVGSFALFSDSDVVADNTFDTGSIALSLDQQVNLHYDVVDMMPGDIEYAGVRVTNSGTNDLRYALSFAPHDDGASLLDTQLNLWVNTDEGSGTCTAADFNGETDLYDGTFVDVDGYLFGAAPDPGADNGERVLSATDSEYLCFRVELPLSSGNLYQDQQLDNVVFTWTSEQVENN